MRRLVPTLLAAVALAGCGNARQQPPDVIHPDAPQGNKDVKVKDTGISYSAPFNWPNVPAAGKLVSGIRSKTATVSIWRYTRDEPLPEDRKALEQVKGLLEARVKQRNPTFELRESTIVRRAGVDAIELLGSQTIAGLPYDVRSAHLFKEGAEVVVDAIARPEDFERVDQTVFEPLLRSLKVTKP